jgi:hypothetical protein
MKVFTVEDYVPVPTQEFLLIQEFKELFAPKYNSNFDGDTTGKYKKRGHAEARFLFFFCDYKSEFAKFDEDSRKTESLTAAGLPADYKISEKLEAAVNRYNTLKVSRNLRLLNSANKAIDKLEKYFSEVDFTAIHPDGSPKYNPKDIISNISNLGKVLEGLEKLKEAVEKEEGQEASARGDAEKGRLG